MPSIQEIIETIGAQLVALTRTSPVQEEIPMNFTEVKQPFGSVEVFRFNPGPSTSSAGATGEILTCNDVPVRDSTDHTIPVITADQIRCNLQMAAVERQRDAMEQLLLATKQRRDAAKLEKQRAKAQRRAQRSSDAFERQWWANHLDQFAKAHEVINKITRRCSPMAHQAPIWEMPTKNNFLGLEEESEAPEYFVADWAEVSKPWAKKLKPRVHITWVPVTKDVPTTRSEGRFSWEEIERQGVWRRANLKNKETQMRDLPFEVRCHCSSCDKVCAKRDLVFNLSEEAWCSLPELVDWYNEDEEYARLNWDLQIYRDFMRDEYTSWNDEGYPPESPVHMMKCCDFSRVFWHPSSVDPMRTHVCKNCTNAWLDRCIEENLIDRAQHQDKPVITKKTCKHRRVTRRCERLRDCKLCKCCKYHCQKRSLRMMGLPRDIEFGDLMENTWLELGGHPEEGLPLSWEQCLMYKRSGPHYGLPRAQLQMFDFNIPEKFDILHNLTTLNVTHVLEMPAVSQFIAYLKQKKEGVDWVQVFKELCYFAYVCYQTEFRVQPMTIALAHLISNLPLGEFANKFLLMFSSPLQSGVSEGAIGALTIALTVISTLAVGAFPHSKFITTFVTRLAKVGQSLKSVDEIRQRMPDIIKMCLDYYRKHVYGVDSADIDIYKESKQWISEVQALNTTNFETRAKDDYGLKQTVDDLIQRGVDIQKFYDSLKIPVADRREVNECSMLLREMRRIIATRNAGSTRARAAPVAVHLFGNTGCGKSTIVSSLSAVALVHLGHTNPSALHDLVYYNYPTESGFKDGYRNGTEIIVMDDAFTRKDSASNPNPEIQDIIRFCNVSFYWLNMADLRDKGTTLCEPKFVILTSNRPDPAMDSVTNKEAVVRRIDLKYQQIPHPKFAVARTIMNTEMIVLDVNKAKAWAVQEGKSLRDCILFNKIDPHNPNGALLRSGMTFAEVAQEVRAELTRAREVGDLINDDQKEFFKQLVDERTEKEKEFVVTKTRSDEEEFELRQLRDDIEDLTKKCIEEEAKCTQSTPELNLQSGLCKPADTTHDIEVREPDGCLKFFDQTSWFNRSFFGHMDHVNIYDSLNNVAINTIPFNVDPTHETLVDHAWILNAKCVVAHKTSIFNFLRYYKTAVLAAQALEPAYRINVFNQVMDMYNDKYPLTVMFCENEDHHDDRALAQFLHTTDKRQETFLQRVSRYFHGSFDLLMPMLCAAIGAASYMLVDYLGAKLLGKVIPTYDYEISAVHILFTRVLSFAMPDYIRWMHVFYETDGWRNPKKVSAEDWAFVAEYMPWTLKALTEKEKKTLLQKHPGTRTQELISVLEQYNLRKDAAQKVVKTEQYDVRKDQAQKVVKTEGAELQPVNHVVLTEGGHLHLQGTTDQNALEIRNKVFKNQYRLTTTTLTGEAFLGTCTFVKGRVAIFNRHFTTAFGSSVSLYSPILDTTYTCPTSDLNMSDLPIGETHGHKDVVMCEFPTFVRIHPDITSYFMTSADFSRHKMLDLAVLSGCGRQGGLETYTATHVNGVDLLQMNVNGETWNLRQTYTYNVPTQRGDCGKILIAFDKRFERKICALHMAGSDQPFETGVGTSVTQEVLQALRSALTLRRKESWIDGEVEVAIPQSITLTSGGKVVLPAPLPGGFIPIGETSTPAHANVKTQIRPSPLHGVIAVPKTAPAHLKRFKNDAGEIVDPLVIAMAKARTPEVHVPLEYIEQACNNYRSLLLRNIDRDDCRLLTFPETVMGVEGNEWVPPINRKTSPGHGWPAIGGGKKPYLGHDDRYILDHPTVIARYKHATEQLRKGRRVSTLWNDTLKDERRLIEKVKDGKTRLFAAGEMIYTLIFRRYFGGYAAHMARNRISTESCVGVNPLGYDWTRLAHYLQEVGPHVIAGDFTNYDGTLSAAILWGVLDDIEEFYKQDWRYREGDAEIRRLLWLEIVNSLHASGKNIIMWLHSQPSGCPITSILNSHYKSLALRIVWKKCATQHCPKYASLSYFRKFVRLAGYGDDDVINIHPEVIDWFNQITISDAYKTLGMVYTDETKSGELIKCRTLSEVAFLKRRFRWDEEQSRYRAPLSLETIDEMAMWVGKGDKWVLTAETLEQAVEELSEHGRPVFESRINVFKTAQAIVQQYTPCVLNTYEEYQQTHLARCYEESEKLCDRDTKTTGVILGVANPARVASESGQSWIERQVGGLFRLHGSQLPIRKRAFLANKIAARRAVLQSGSSAGSSNRPTETAQPTSILANPIISSVLPSGPSAMLLSTQQQEVTTFHEDGEVGHEQRVQPTRTPRKLTKDAQDRLVNDVKGFLSRPVEMKNFTWAASTGSLGTLWTVDLPSEWLQIQMVQEKLKGFRYLRCDFVIKIQVNAQAFNAGRMLAVFEPLWSQNTWQPSSTYSLQGLTGYRRVDLDLADTTAVEIRIPFFGTMSHYDLLLGFGTAGRLFGEVYSPLTGSTDVEGTVWCWAENIDITMPTGVPLVFPTGVASSDRFITRLAQAELQAGDEAADDIAEFASSSAGAGGQAKERARRGTIETIAKTTKKVCRALGAIPLIGQAFTYAAWGAQGLELLAHSFGWSKPADPEFTKLYVPSVQRQMANYDGDSKAKHFGLSSRNDVDIPHDVYGTHDDEMALATILSHSTFMDFFTMTGAQTTNTLLWKWPADPTACKKATYTGPAHAGIVSFNTYPSYMSNFALMWRGSLKYCVKIVKTKFHSGRIRVVFAPGATLATDPSTLDINKMYSKVYDLRECNEFDFSVPFTWNAPWKRFGNATPTTALTDEVPQGMVYVFVVNKLLNPDTAASQIEFLVETSVGEDFQLAYPGIRPTGIKVIDRAENIPAPTVTGTLQAGEQIYPANDLPGIDPNALAVGEVFTSLRQLCKRYHLMTNGLAKDVGTISPFSTITSAPAVQTNLDYLFDDVQDIYTFVSTLYRFYSGPMRVMLTTQNNTTSSRFSIIPTGSKPAVSVPVLNPSPPGMGFPEHVWFKQLEPAVEFEIPFYQPFLALPTDVGYPAEASYDNVGAVYTRLPCDLTGTMLTSEAAIPATDNVYRQLGERFTFGYLLGPPTTIQFTS